MVDQPTGAVTLVFTDIEGSTALLRELGQDAYHRALAEHRRVVRACFGGRGYEVDFAGDGFFYAFNSAAEAVAAAEAAIRGLQDGPIRIRVGIHTGAPGLDPPKYFGMDVHLAARVMAAGHGGQVLLTQTTRDLVDVESMDLGEHRLKDFAEPLSIYQLGTERFLPLKTISNTNLPHPASAFVGREQELDEVVARIRHGVRFLTLTGPGGSGKTRLALEAASTMVADFKAGVFWIGLASVRDPALLTERIAQALGAKEDAAAAIGERELLLLLDNLEQVVEAAPSLSALVRTCPNLTLLCTSRERLRVDDEVEYPVLPLAEPDAVRLFCERSGLTGSGLIGEICGRLDNLPLAVELAAARTKVLTPRQMLERLHERLDLFKGGRGADPRQQTLRATIEWSHELLSADEQRLFRALAVFSGCTLEAAEAVCGATLDLLQSLSEKSLVRFSNERYWMLETIREYAAEQLRACDDARELSRRQAEWTCAFAESVSAAFTGRSGTSAELETSTDDAFDRLDSESGNIDIALEWAWASGENELALRLGSASIRLWLERDRFREARRWLDTAVPRIAHASAPIELQALKTAGVIAYFVEADLAAADRYWSSAESLARNRGDEDELAWIEYRRAAVAQARGDSVLAQDLCHSALAHARSRIDRNLEADVLHQLGELLRDLGRFDEAEAMLLQTDALLKDLGSRAALLAANTHGLGDLALDRGDLMTAEQRYRLSLEQISARSIEHSLYCLAGLASVRAAGGDDETGAILWGATCTAEKENNAPLLAHERRRYERHLHRLEGGAPWKAGSAMRIDEAVELAQSLPPISPIA